MPDRSSLLHKARQCCGSNPSWLDVERRTGTLFWANEAYTVPNAGSLAALFKESLSILDNVTTDYGPAQSAFFATNRLGLAHYAGGAVSVYDISDPSNLVELQNFHYFMDKPYLHGIVADPTGNFVVVLDRGADALRTYSVGWDDRLIELGSYFTEPGNGPRHGVLVEGTSKTIFYMLGELANSLHGFEGESSDTIVSYSVDFDAGDLRLIGLTTPGGLWPRTFAISEDGTLTAVADQYNVPGRLIICSRDLETGIIDDQISLATWTTDITLPDGQSISHILWVEQASARILEDDLIWPASLGPKLRGKVAL
ncbi:putative isomerase YbhE [Biscogniauxia marginata]|nr:putative isomerase YbhE [Biscogniauxia marginata]